MTIMTGFLFEQGTDNPLPDLYIEIYGSNSGPGFQQQWFGGAKPNSAGYYRIQLREDGPTPQYPLTIVIFLGDHVIHSINTSSSNNIIRVPMLHYNLYNMYLYGGMGAGEQVDPTHIKKDLFFIVKGKFTNQSGVPLDYKTIRASAKGFRIEPIPIICRTQTDMNGDYSMKIAYASLTGGAGLVIDFNGWVSSPPLYEIAREQEINLQYNLNVNRFGDLYQQIHTVTSLINFSGITTEGPDRETIIIARSIGVSEEEVLMMVRARVHVVNYGLHYEEFLPIHNLYYQGLFALLYSGIPDDPKELFGLSMTTMMEIFTDAFNNGIVSYENSAAEFEVVAERFQDLGNFNSLNTPISDTSPDTIESYFAQSPYHTASLDYILDLSKYDKLEDNNVAQFWDDFATSTSQETAEEAQFSLQLASVTGFQGQMSGYLANMLMPRLDLSLLTKYTMSEWVSHITIAGGTNAVPAFINEQSEDPIQDYAGKLYAICQNAYPAISLAEALRSSFGPDLINDAPTRIQVISFLESNPDFDLRSDSVYDVTDEESELLLAFVSNAETVKNALIPFQTLSRIADGRTDAVVAMKLGGIDNAAAAASMSQAQFTDTFEHAFGGTSYATDAYVSALKISEISTSATANLSRAISGPSTAVIALPAKPDPIADPDLATMFANLEQCGCSECMSVYSAGAYFVDILNFIGKYGRSNPVHAFYELHRRRSDLFHIDISCKNANTALPYIDLVNERLEVLILEHLGAHNIPESFQTTATATELSAYPEHVYRTSSGNFTDYTGYDIIYDSTLTGAVFPLTLPFQYPLNETRVYLKHLGYSRADLMKLLWPYHTAPTPMADIEKYTYYTEATGMNRGTADIISKNDGKGTWSYYGLNQHSNEFISPSDSSVMITGSWLQLLSGTASQGGLDVLLYLLDIDFIKLRQLLEMDFLNPKISGTPRISIKHRDDAPDDTCILREQKLNFDDDANNALKTTFFDKLHRVVRLHRETGTGVYELDVILRAFNASDIINTVSQPLFENIMRLITLSRKLRLAPEILASWWTVLDTHTYRNFNSDQQSSLPSIYDRTFRSKSVSNPPVPAFAPDQLGNSEYKEYTAVIIAACGISEEDLVLLMSENALHIDADSPMSVTGLSRIFGASQVCRSLRLKMQDFIRICRMNGIGFGNVTPSPTLSHVITQLNNIETLQQTLQDIAESGFSLDEICYLIVNQDETRKFTTETDQIQIFYEAMRDDMQKVYVDVSGLTDPAQIKAHEDALRNAVIQHFTTFMPPGAETTREILQALFMIGYDPSGNQSYADEFILDAIICPDFVLSEYPLSAESIAERMDPLSATPKPHLDLNGLYPLYTRMHKMSLFFTRSGARQDEIATLQNKAAGLAVADLRDFPYEAAELSNPELFEQFLRYLRWMKARRLTSAAREDFRHMVDIVLEGSKSRWIALVAKLTAWEVSFITELVGTDDLYSASGVLNTIYADDPGLPSDFRDPELLLRLYRIRNILGAIGLSATQTIATLDSNVQMNAARNVRMAARSKHTAEAWTTIAKPLQDPLREQQRDALVSFLLSVPVAGTKAWRTKNDLYAWLLLDVEMQPCTLTSRIRLALSSVQMYMGRVIMNLETVVVEGLTHTVTIPEDAISQWEAWRKWYRVWEANRKIFLYPENWIEPELRDNKTQFFRAFESELMQNELNAGNVENAVLSYLEKLDEVARLEPVAVYHELEYGNSLHAILYSGPPTRDITHVVARTIEKPHIYYYRNFADGEWSAWEKMEISPASDHITLFVWERRLHIFWLSFMEKQVENYEVEMRITESIVWGNRHSNLLDEGQWLGAWMREDIEYILRRKKASGTDFSLDDVIRDIMKGWDITLNWSEYKQGKWNPPLTGSETMALSPVMISLTPPQRDSISANLTHNDGSAYYATTRRLRQGSFAPQSFKLSANELFKNRLYLYPETGSGGSLILNILHPPGMDERSIGLNAFRFDYMGASPKVVTDMDYPTTIIAPSNTILNKMQFEQTPASPLSKVFVDSYSADPAQQFFPYRRGVIATGIESGLSRSGSSVLLNSVPAGNYRILSKSNLVNRTPSIKNNPMREDFFFSDFKNLFFVKRKEKAPLAHIAATTKFSTVQSLSASSITATMNYSMAGPQPTTMPPLNFSTSFITVAPPAVGYYNPDLQVYDFNTFYHPHVNNFVKALKKDGIDGFLNLRTQTQQDTMSFEATYSPTDFVHRKEGVNKYATDIVDFAYDSAYSIYNWELFFHIPVTVAQRLSDNQQFEDAQKWYHYIFNPTSNTDANGTISTSRQRFWKCRPFYDEAGKQIVTLKEMMDDVDKYSEQINVWERNPFNPHVIARMRIMAYMKNVVMKYLDNLIAWGDQLFRRDTIESLNEATQLYILASNILGPRPMEIPPLAPPAVYSFTGLDNVGLDGFSNARVQMESMVKSQTSAHSGSESETPTMQYFCLPQNDQLLRYWDTVADRLFKIRNCMNIEGMIRQLPLFDPPIDPAMLVRAAASGVDINGVLNLIAGIGAPQYRFSHVLQRANEVCGDLKALGSSLLAALEKKDAEALSLIRSGHEIKVLEAVKSIRESQVSDAEEAIEALKKTREVTELRQKYYSSRPYMIGGEKQHLQSIELATILQAVQAGISNSSSVLFTLPNVHIQATASGISFGGSNIASAMNATGAALGIGAMIANAQATMAVTRAGYDRRRDDWEFQTESAAREIEQIDQQLIGAEIRLDIARKELANTEMQIENSMETDAYMRSKYTNQELYSWMISQISTVYFQSYQLAFDVASKAETCLKNEMPFASDKMPKQGFVKFGYWDSLKKGLLSGEKLQYDLRKMEIFQIEENKRELELTKHVSLAFLDPGKLMELKTKGICSDLAIPEELFDLDYPGHYMRRIKSVSITIPCVAGPYTTISCQLSQTGSKYRKTPTIADAESYKSGEFVSFSAGDTIVTSSAQNDNGMFELNFRDERYLPFEGSGAESTWTLSMPSVHPLFDHNTIQDVIIHIRYTARIGSPLLAQGAELNLDNLFTNGTLFPRIFSLTHEFPDTWSAGMSRSVAVSGSVTPLLPAGQARPFALVLGRGSFPQYAQQRDISIEKFSVSMVPGKLLSADVRFYLRIGADKIVELTSASGYSGESATLSLSIPAANDSVSADLSFYKRLNNEATAVVPVETGDLEDLFITAHYSLSSAL